MTTLKALTVKINEVPIAGLDCEYTNQSGELNEALFDILGDYPVYKTSLHVKIVDDMTQIKGQVSGELNHVCSRCADEFHTHYSKNFTTMYYQSESSIKTLNSDINDIEGSFDLEFLEGNEINLGEVIHEQIALEVPFQPLCTEQCKGLCSRCGTNLNIGSCQCDATINVSSHSPFEKLKGLRGE